MNDAVRPTEDILENWRRWNTSKMPSLLMLAFFAAIFPFAWNYVKHHPDERHYTDAASIMVETGDYATPFTPEGDLRLKKPILTYWMVAVGYKFFGISSLTSRLPFLVLGTLIVGLTYRLCKELEGSRQIALLAACIVAIQPSLIISSMRSIPDVVLTFCLLVSGIGFVRLLNRSKPDWRSIAAAYGGLGLAVEAKGLPALVFGILAMSSLVAFRSQALRSYWLRHLTGTTVFMTVAFGWFIAMYGLHQQELLEQFFGDQVGDRVNRSPSSVLMNFGVVIGLTVTSCLPWIGAVMDALFRRISRLSFSRHNFNRRDDALAETYSAKLLLVAWVIVYLVLASSIEGPNMRYLCTISPFLACLVACQVGQLSDDRMGLWLKRINHFTAFSLILTALLLFFACHVFGCDPVLPWIASVAVLALSVSALNFASSPAKADGHLFFAVAGQIAFIPLAYVAFQSFACSHFEKQLVDQYSRLTTGQTNLIVTTNPAHASRIRVASGGTLSVQYRDKDVLPLLDNNGSLPFGAILMEQCNVNHFNLNHFCTHQIRDGYAGLKPGAFISAIVAGRANEYLKHHEQNLLLAIRHPSTVLHASYIRYVSHGQEVSVVADAASVGGDAGSIRHESSFISQSFISHIDDKRIE